MNGLQNVFKGVSAKDLSGAIASGGSKYMVAGDWPVKVTGVDRSKIDDNKVTVVYTDAQGREYKDQLFTTSTNQKTGALEISWRFRDTLGMLLGTVPDVIGAFMSEVMANNWSVLDLFVGLSGMVTLGRTKGYSPAEAAENNGYSVFNCAKPEQQFWGATIEAAQREAEKAGLKKGYLNITRYEPTNVAGNVEVFTAGIVALLWQPPAGRAQLGYSGVARGAGSI